MDTERTDKKRLPDHPWARSFDDALKALDSESASGLSDAEAAERRSRYGKNRLRKIRSRSAADILVEQFKSVVIGILSAAAVVSFVFGQTVEGIAVAAAVLLNTLIGFFTELRAVRSMDALRKLSRVKARVRRRQDKQARVSEIPADELVPGDIVLLEGGDVVTADIRLGEANRLNIDESVLTGESVSVSKNTQSVEKNMPLAERRCMAYKGTAVTRGSGMGVVAATGEDTELGRISQLVKDAEQGLTPLEKRLDRLGRRLVWITLALAAVVTGLGILRGKSLLLMVESGVALAVAAIPEGLPIVATVALARGMMRMAKRNALVRRLSSVETLGSANVICTDKTGTLTENRMKVTRIILDEGGFCVDEEGKLLDDNDRPVEHAEDRPVLCSLIRTGVLCNNASLDASDDERGVGEPLEIALLKLGRIAGMERGALLKKEPEKHEEAFDPEVKMMATVHASKTGLTARVKGAPEAVLDACSHIRGRDGSRDLDETGRKRWKEINHDMAAQGLRVLALAERQVSEPGADPYTAMTFLGLTGMHDPPRAGVDESIRACRDAGIRVVMVTGDQPDTAAEIARMVNLTHGDDPKQVHGSLLEKKETLSREDRRRIQEGEVFARVTPEQKLHLVDILQQQGLVVAMTGDGVNDAPALRKADIGIAMGRRGTEVAKQASDMILKDDSLSTLAVAIEQGRIIFNNIRKFILFLLSGNTSEIMVIAAASIAGLPLPLLPLQILFLNLVLDVFPALALGLGEGSGNEMRREPRKPETPVLTGAHWRWVGGYAAIIAVTVLGAFMLVLKVLQLPESSAVTVSFLTLSFGRLWHVFNLRDADSSFLHNDVIRNPFVWGAIGFCILLIVSVVCVGPFSKVLELERLPLTLWLLAGVAGCIPFAVGQLLKKLGIDKTIV